MSDGSVTTATDLGTRGEPNRRGVSAAKYLVAFVFLINVCFFFYMIAQFFAAKPYGNGLHAIYVAIVLATTVLLGCSARGLWTGRTRQGTYCFFCAIAVSFVGNLASQWFA